MTVNVLAKISWAEVPALEKSNLSRHPSPICWTLPWDGLGGCTQDSALWFCPQGPCLGPGGNDDLTSLHPQLLSYLKTNVFTHHSGGLEPRLVTGLMWKGVIQCGKGGWPRVLVSTLFR